MNNVRLNREMRVWARLRQEWIDKLATHPNSDDACLHIIRINAKLEMLRFQWNWHDETVEMEVYR